MAFGPFSLIPRSLRDGPKRRDQEKKKRRGRGSWWKKWNSIEGARKEMKERFDGEMIRYGTTDRRIRKKKVTKSMKIWRMTFGEM